MTARRTTRLLVLFGLSAVLVFGLSLSPAEASNFKHHGHKFHHYNFAHKVHKIHHVDYCPPLVKYIQQPYIYPVVLYDCYGQPYTIWKTGYNSVPVTYHP